MIRIRAASYFKEEDKDHRYFKEWVSALEKQNGRTYKSIEVHTSLGKTQVWALNEGESELETLVIFPGARTTSLIWDFDKGLDNLDRKMRIFMVETNGLPNLSEGKTPDIQSLDYGHWAEEVLDGLSIHKAFIAGASFGGLICMKLAIISRARISAVFLLNPGCLQPFSLSFKNLYYNLLPIIYPSKKNVSTFLDHAVFCKPIHHLSPEAERLLIDYEVFAIRRYRDHSPKPYYMDKQLQQVKVDTYLLEGDKDLLFPFRKSIDNARIHISHLKDVMVFENVGHGIETYDKAINYIGSKIASYPG